MAHILSPFDEVDFGFHDLLVLLIEIVPIILAQIHDRAADALSY